jgi:thiol-disulfide isomerase/thioredoxin
MELHMHKLTIVFLGLILGNISMLELVAQAATTQEATTAPTATIAQSGNVGGALAKKLQGKPVVVEIYASWCPACKNVAPTISQLKREYGGKANFVVFDVSNGSKTAQSKNLAQQLGLAQFFAENASQTGLVAIIDPANGNILTQYRNNANKSDYATVLDAAIR